MNLRMTVLATPIQQPRVRRAANARVASNKQIVGVASIRVALLAQKRPRRSKQHVVIRAMGFMTIHAIVAYRRVLPQERAAFFGMAGITN